MKGIILAGGTGTRLYPLTQVVSKQLLPVYDKPMIFYPLSVLMEADIREILIISTPRDVPIYKELLGDGSQLGLQISYVEQAQPEGLAQAFILGSSFIKNDSVCLILGDNIFSGAGFRSFLAGAKTFKQGGLICGVKVDSPKEFGVVEFDEDGTVRSIEEKPEHPKSSYAVPGIYFYDNMVTKIAREVRPSHRGELEITAINQEYLKRNQLKVELLSEEDTWLDTGTHCSLHSAANYVQKAQEESGLRIGYLEEIAYSKGYIDLPMLKNLAAKVAKSDYGKNLLAFAETESTKS